MINLFNNSKPNSEAIKRIKYTFSEHFAFLETTTLQSQSLTVMNQAAPPLKQLLLHTIMMDQLKVGVLQNRLMRSKSKIYYV